MSLRNTVLGTVIGGVILTPIVWLLESIKSDLPIWLGASVDFLWAPIAVPRAVAWITSLAIGFLVFDYWFTLRAKKQEAIKAQPSAVPPPLVPRESAATVVHPLKLGDDEETVLAALAKYGNSAHVAQLLPRTKMSEFQFETAVGRLKEKLMVSDSKGYNGRAIIFKQAGREYAAKHQLDTRM
ncbi:MAG: hypothetical protein Q7V53_07275 [Caldisericota bacterium]|nr:hypothetical protein [Caldisericota bacterium]